MRAPVLRFPPRARFGQAAIGVLLSGLSVGVRAQSVDKHDLSPTAAAHTLESPTLVPPPSGPSLGSRAEPPASTTRAASASAADETREPDVEEIELPGLERGSDGSYRFQGTNFRASISRDGQVTFRDTYVGFSRRMTPLPAPPRDRETTPDGAQYARSTPWLALQFRIDLYAWLEKRLGNDPYLSERRWFMERTRVLRESLANRALSRSLRTALLRIWSDAGLSLAARKQETFELWNHTSVDESGDVARAAVENFVRERCPVNSSCEFRPGELERFNDKRAHARAFAPYGEPHRSRQTAVANEVSKDVGRATPAHAR
jgi:hypothetical protein